MSDFRKKLWCGHVVEDDNEKHSGRNGKWKEMEESEEEKHDEEGVEKLRNNTGRKGAERDRRRANPGS